MCPLAELHERQQNQLNAIHDGCIGHAGMCVPYSQRQLAEGSVHISPNALNHRFSNKCTLLRLWISRNDYGIPAGAAKSLLWQPFLYVERR